MVVQHNLTAMNANRYLGINNSKLSKSLEKLSSGYAINRAGDNAAGLAVSEKMRSQIAGMTQGVKNAQDGISMVQTFEGALTETDSILQRMKTLADQAANGTYQDDVDRDAIQLEFDQLNDELNQIADTDFNGVVVLNGGQMADGTVAVDGKFDYSLGRTTTVVAAEADDLSADQKHTIVDQTTYDKKTADAVYDALGIDVKDVANDNGKATVNVTFMYDGSRWNAQTVTTKDKNGKDVVVDGANAAKLEARAVERDDATGKGGFQVIAGKDPFTSEDIIATNAIFDEMKGADGKGLKMGDTITISFDNTAAKTYAPKNAGIDEDYTITPGTGATDHLTKTDVVGKLGFELDKSVTDAVMTSAVKDELKALDDIELTVEYAGGKAEITGTDAAGKITVTDNGDGTATVKGVASGLTLGVVSAADINADKPAQASKAIVGAAAAVTGETGAISVDVAALETQLTTAQKTLDGANVTITFNIQADGTIKVNGTGIDPDDYGITCVNGFDNVTQARNFTVTYTPGKKATSGADTTANGTIACGVNVDAYNVVDLNDIEVHAIATPKIATMAHQVAQDGVSKSNAYKNGAAPLTYTDNITLQTGARSKDAVNFTFKYTSGGMGNLKSNMNCSAREDGLNTASLSLKTAESANYAIDQIDNAINKVSMVRATFGAVQNRLEHKIDNMNVSIENLTSAESQIRDTNMPQEMMNFTKQQILAQASQSMLAQANQLPQSVLSLLQ